MKVMILVTHLLGTGHLARAVTLAEAFGAASHDVAVVSGGTPVPRLEKRGVRIVQLPPVRSDGADFSRVLDAGGSLADSAYLAKRQAELIDFLHDFEPDVLITELFPFGRRSLRGEFLAVLDAATSRPEKPLVCASIRDILAPPGKEKKRIFADETVARFYDAVLVHSDPAVTPLDLSWPVSDMLAARLEYTGFVAPPPAGPHPDGCGKDEVLISAGGGDVGAALFACACDAAALMPERTWRILVGGPQAGDRIAGLRQDAPANVVVEAARDDFRQMLTQAAASVSFCGYNTAMDLLQSGCPAVLVPFDDGNEVEQSIRAEALARLPGFAVLPTQDMSAEAMCRAVTTVTEGSRRGLIHTSADGAAETVRIVERLAGRHG